MMWKAALIASLVVVGAVAALWIGVWRSSSTPSETLSGMTPMTAELSDVGKILWIGPHADDEVYVAGLLYYSHTRGWECVIAAYNASEARRDVNRRSAEFLGCRYVYASEYPGESPAEKIRSLLLAESPDVVVTFHPETGFRGNEAHKAVGRIVTELVEGRELDARLFYVLNRDPALEDLLGGADSASPTHYLNLKLQASADRSLFEVKLADICLYSELVPAAKAICKDVNGVATRMLGLEFYLKYGSNG